MSTVNSIFKTMKKVKTENEYIYIYIYIAAKSSNYILFDGLVKSGVDVKPIIKR